MPFWNYVSAKRKGTNELISLKGNGDEDILDDLDIAQTMNAFFASVFTDEDCENLPLFEGVVNDVEFTSLQCSPADVCKLLSELKPNKSPGTDQIHPKILRNCCHSLAPSLCKLFNLSFSYHYGTVPDQWKLADTIPLHKKGPKNQREIIDPFH